MTIRERDTSNRLATRVIFEHAGVCLIPLGSLANQYRQDIKPGVISETLSSSSSTVQLQDTLFFPPSIASCTERHTTSHSFHQLHQQKNQISKMSDDWNSVTKIGSKVSGGGSQRETVIKGKGALNQAARSGAIVGTEKKFATGNQVSSRNLRSSYLSKRAC